MARRDRGSAVGLALVAVAYLVAGRGYPLDTLAAPGPGVFPLTAGIGLLAIAAWQIVTVRGAPSPTETVATPRRHSPLIMAAALVLYAATLPKLGFLVTSLVVVFVAARLMGLGGWWRPAALALGVTVASRLLFVTWLGVPLP